MVKWCMIHICTHSAKYCLNYIIVPPLIFSVLGEFKLYFEECLVLQYLVYTV